MRTAPVTRTLIVITIPTISMTTETKNERRP
jgi:hypothetical protein